MIKIEKFKNTSLDIEENKINKLKDIFPEIFSENKLNFEAFKEIFKEDIEEENERYSFNWPGKNRARRIAQEMSTGTILPVKEDSKNWENTDNLYIEGDNLEVLKLLQKSYHSKIKMIYIDPPYNTGKDFVYPDNFKDNLKNYLEITGQVGEEGQKLSTNSDVSGRYHSNWLNMIYPRLKLARNLLSSDGVIFISIDDNEQSNLKKICDEIFGEENFVANLIWRKRKTQANLMKNIAPVHEFILCYSKNNSFLNFNKLEYSEEFINKTFKNQDNDPKGLYQTRPLAQPQTSTNSEYEIILPNGRKITAKWSCSKSTYEKYIAENRLYIPNDGEGMPRLKIYLDESEGILPNTWLDDHSTTEEGSKEIKNLFESIQLFDFPKPTNLIKYLLKLNMNSKDIILDFFSGSSTTAQATMQLNAEDGGNRKYIMVQLPEPTPDNSEASKAGYKTICEIGKERIRRAGEKIKSDETLSSENREKLDAGFKVFKLSTSNIKEWDSETENLRESLFDSIDNIKSDRTSLDVLYEILLKYGLDLNMPIVKDDNFYSIGGGTLIINLEKKINLDVIDSICEEYKTLLEIDEDYKTTVVLRDSSFQNDVDKTNAIQKLKQAGIKEIRSI